MPAVPRHSNPAPVRATKTRERPLPTRLHAQVEITAARHKDLDPTTLHLLLAMYRSFATLDRDQSEEVRAIDLTGTQFNILTTLERAGGPVSMGELAAMMVLQPTNLSGIVNKIADRGLVRRDVNTTDQRSFLVALTPAGQRLLDGFLPGHWRHLEGLMNGLTRGERVSLVELLRKLLVSIQDAEATAPARVRRAPLFVPVPKHSPRVNGIARG